MNLDDTLKLHEIALQRKLTEYEKRLARSCYYNGYADAIKSVQKVVDKLEKV